MNAHRAVHLFPSHCHAASPQEQLPTATSTAKSYAASPPTFIDADEPPRLHRLSLLVAEANAARVNESISTYATNSGIYNAIDASKQRYRVRVRVEMCVSSPDWPREEAAASLDAA